MLNSLPPRERQIVDLLYARQEATAAEICEAFGGEVGNSAMRAMLRRLEAKGFVQHRVEGMSYVYSPALPKSGVRRSALLNVVKTFFDGSAAGAASALLDLPDIKEEEFDKLEALIARARKNAGRAPGADD